MLLHNILDAPSFPEVWGGLCLSPSSDASTQVEGVSSERTQRGNTFPLAFFFFFSKMQSSICSGDIKFYFIFHFLLITLADDAHAIMLHIHFLPVQLPICGAGEILFAGRVNYSHRHLYERRPPLLSLPCGGRQPSVPFAQRRVSL